MDEQIEVKRSSLSDELDAQSELLRSHFRDQSQRDQNQNQKPEQQGTNRIDLGDKGVAIRSEGIIRFHLMGTEIFSIDANSIPFERKVCVAILQVFIHGQREGRKSENASIREKVNGLVKLLLG